MRKSKLFIRILENLINTLLVIELGACVWFLYTISEYLLNMFGPIA